MWLKRSDQVATKCHHIINVLVFAWFEYCTLPYCAHTDPLFMLTHLVRQTSTQSLCRGTLCTRRALETVARDVQRLICKDLQSWGRFRNHYTYELITSFMIDATKGNLWVQRCLMSWNILFAFLILFCSIHIDDKTLIIIVYVAY